MTRPKILFVSRNVPYPQIAGSSQRTAILCDALSQIGDVSLFIIGPPAVKPFLEQVGYRVAATAEPLGLSNRFIGKILNRFIPGLAERIWRVFAGVKVDYTPDTGMKNVLVELVAKEKFDLIVGRYLIASAQTGVFEQKQLPVIVDIDDVDTKAISAKIASPATNWLVKKVLAHRLPRVVEYEKLLWKKSNKIWFSNPDDKLSYNYIESDVVQNIPFKIPDRSSLTKSGKDSQVILWVGSFNHAVNLSGVDFFLDQIWAEVVQCNPAARFRIVGSHLPDSYRTKWSAIKNVDVVGFAESLEPHYSDAAFSIVPLLDGAGTKIKVLESLGYMRACVVTRHSIAGFEDLLKDGEAIRVGSDLKDLVQPIIDLLNDNERRWQMEERGRSLIEQHFTRAAVHEAVARSVASLDASWCHAN